MKKYLLLVSVLAALSVPSVLSAQPSPEQIVAIQKWWMETGGPAAQKALGHKGFRAVKPSIPILIINCTDGDINFALESKNTKRTWHKLEANFQADYFGHNGDKWYNVFFDNGKGGKTHVSFDGGEAIYFTWEEGELRVYSIPPELVRKEK